MECEHQHAQPSKAMSVVLNSSPENMIQVTKLPAPFDINQLYSIFHRAFPKSGRRARFGGEALSCSPANAGCWNRRLGKVVVTSPSCLAIGVSRGSVDM